MRYRITFADLSLSEYTQLLGALESYAGPAPEIVASPPDAPAPVHPAPPAPHTPHSGPAALGKV